MYVQNRLNAFKGVWDPSAYTGLEYGTVPTSEHAAGQFLGAVDEVVLVSPAANEKRTKRIEHRSTELGWYRDNELESVVDWAPDVAQNYIPQLNRLASVWGKDQSYSDVSKLGFIKDKPSIRENRVRLDQPRTTAVNVYGTYFVDPELPTGTGTADYKTRDHRFDMRRDSKPDRHGKFVWW